MSYRYKVIKPCFIDGAYRDPDGKHKSVVRQEIYPEGECPSCLELDEMHAEEVSPKKPAKKPAAKKSAEKVDAPAPSDGEI